jgi:DNA polymerase I-like protein with 3'-5' exonuclease and polymerase domains
VDAIAIVAPGVHAWTQRVQAQVRAGMSTFTTYSGRVIHLDTKRPYAAVNYMVQGTAREILVDALIKWDDGLYGGGLVLPVHDELLAWVPSGVAEEASLYLEWCLTAELDGVRIMCEMDPPADRWMSAKS